MSFNFGDKPFKHDLPDGYLPVNKAVKDNVVVNTNGQSSSTAMPKTANNAPQAIIIEVCMTFLIILILLL